MNKFDIPENAFIYSGVKSLTKPLHVPQFSKRSPRVVRDIYPMRILI